MNLVRKVTNTSSLCFPITRSSLRYSVQVSDYMRARRRPRERHSLATMCYYIRSSRSVSWLCTPAILGCPSCVCYARSTPRFLEILPLQNFQRPINSESSFWWRFLACCDSSNNHPTNQPRGQVKQAHSLPREAPKYCISGSPFCSLTSERTIDRLCPSWPPSTSPRRSWRSSRDGGRSRLSRHKYALGHPRRSDQGLEEADSILPRSNSLRADRDTPFTTVPHLRLVSRMFSHAHSSPPELL